MCSGLHPEPAPSSGSARPHACQQGHIKRVGPDMPAHDLSKAPCLLWIPLGDWHSCRRQPQFQLAMARARRRIDDMGRGRANPREQGIGSGGGVYKPAVRGVWLSMGIEMVFRNIDAVLGNFFQKSPAG